MVQLSHLHMTTGKTTALTIQTFVSKVMSLLFNRLSRFVIAFLAVSRHLIHDDGIFEYIVKWLPALLYIHQLVMLQFFFLVMRIFCIYSSSKLQVYNIVSLTIVTMQCIISLGHTYFISGSLYLWPHQEPQPLATSNIFCFYEFGFCAFESPQDLVKIHVLT